ncbi:MAG: Ppx/GppA family phosphatase [Erythrobacter sp.]|nr:Ppx/GppA family phosphatase [Erythrobacter sp.]
MRTGSGGGRSRLADRPTRAVIDIGSNTVRLVVYAAPQRAPSVWLNEKVTARLGRDLATSGKLPEEAMALALRGLARFASILRDIGVAEVRTVATAAVRDAKNGAAFVERVQALGLAVEVLSGEEEAFASAYGVIGAFPGAEGVVADLGGGSLELVGVAGDAPSHGVSLPALRAKGTKAFNKAVTASMARADWAAAHPGPLYLVGGTWRALAAFAMHKAHYPLSDPHAYAVEIEEADRLAKQLARMAPAELTAIAGISSSRAAGLPDAAAMLRPLMAALQPERLVFSSWGLREGLLFRELDAGAQRLDPLLAAVAHFTEARGASQTLAAQVAGWSAAAANGRGLNGSGGSERLRLAAIMLAMAQTRLEPNMRLKHSVEWALDKRWLGLDHHGRAVIAAMLRGAAGKPEPTPELLTLASEAALVEAAAWGLAFRLCRRLGAGSRMSLMASRLTRDGDVLRLTIERDRAELVSEQVESDLARLAAWLGCEGMIAI